LITCILPEPAVEVAADNTVLPPEQNDAVPVIVATGFAFTVTTKLAEVFVQPLELVTITEYVPAAVAV
jgi:hypothetical protein